MREPIHIKDGDRFQTITEHEESEFVYGSDFLGIHRTDDLIQIQIFWSPGKNAEAKLAMYQNMVDRLGKNPGVHPEDVFTCVFEAAAENWSFGNGEAQFYQAT